MSHYEKAWQAVQDAHRRAPRAPPGAPPDTVHAARRFEDVSGRGGARSLCARASARSARTTCRRPPPSGPRSRDLADIAVAPDRAAPEQQDGAGGRDVRLGGERRPAEDRASGCRRSGRRTARRSTCWCRSTSAARRRRAASRPTRRWRWRGTSPRCRDLRLRGIMGIPAPTDDPATAARAVPRAARDASTRARRAGLPWTRCRWACPRTSKRRSRKASTRGAGGHGDFRREAGERRVMARMPDAAIRTSVTFIGGGNMATALIGGLSRAGADAARLSRRRAARRAAGQARGALSRHRHLRRADGGRGRRRRPRRARREAAADARGGAGARAARRRRAGGAVDRRRARASPISSRWLGGYARIVRAMPNTPALVGAGISGVVRAAGGRRARPRRSPTRCSRRRAIVLWVDARGRCSTRSPAFPAAAPRTCSTFSRRSSRRRASWASRAATRASSPTRPSPARIKLAQASDAEPGDAARAGHVERRHDRARASATLEERAREGRDSSRRSKAPPRARRSSATSSGDDDGASRTCSHGRTGDQIPARRRLRAVHVRAPAALR